jgi:hypothetical protein
MKIAVTITSCVQVGENSFRDVHTTKVFDQSATIEQIDLWAKSINKDASYFTAVISEVVD